MRKQIRVLNNDLTNKYGYSFEVTALEQSLAQQWRSGAPSFISHDYHRPIAWTTPFALWLTPVETALLGKTWRAESNEDGQVIATMARRFIDEKVFAEKHEALQAFPEAVRRLVSDAGRVVNRECLSVVDSGIAKKLLPHLFVSSDLDKRSLVELKHLKVIAPGVYEVDGYVLFAHRFFRRSLSSINNLNQKLLGSLERLASRAGLEVKIALDPDSIGLAGSYRQPIELDFWWGPQFNESLNDIPEGVTRYQSSERDRAYSGVEFTEFWWHAQNGIQSLECEEVNDFPSLGVGEEKFGLRYAHSMVGADGVPYHLDGAIRLYDEDAYLERLGADISKAGKNSAYYKLWRIDGPLSIAEWKSLISDFYKDNHLIGEYFGERRASHPTEQTPDEDCWQRLVHPLLPAPQGVQGCVSYHELVGEASGSAIHICPSDYLGAGGELSVRHIERMAVDYLKRIRRSAAEPVSIADGLAVLGFEDHNVNLPLVVCRGEHAAAHAACVMTCLAQACEELARWRIQLVSASVGVEYDDLMMTFSIIGHPESIAGYLAREVFAFPASSAHFAGWITRLRETMGDAFGSAQGEAHSLGFMTDLGELKVARKHLPAEEWRGSGGQFSPRFKEQALLEPVSSGLLTVAPVFELHPVACGNGCGNHLLCACPPEQGITVDVTPVSAFWARSSTAEP